MRKVVLRKFTKFTRKHLCQSLFFIKKKLPQCATLLKRRDSGTGVSLKKLPQPAILLKKENLAQLFSCEFCEFLRTPF